MPQPLDQEHNEALERALDADRCEASPDARHSWTRKGPPQQVLWDILVTSKKQCAHCGIRARIYDHVRFGELTLKQLNQLPRSSKRYSRTKPQTYSETKHYCSNCGAQTSPPELSHSETHRYCDQCGVEVNPPKRRGIPRSAVTTATVLGVLALFAACAIYGITDGTIVSPSGTATSPPRFRNQPEKEYMLQIINEARAEAGAPAVVMGTNNVAQIQADQLLDDCVLSHWGTDGLKPYMRYSLAGGYQVNGENAYSLNECGLSDTWLQWNEEPSKMVAEAVEGLLESPGHRETMLDSSYSKVNIGLAWSRNTFKAIQHFEGDYVEITRTPTIQAGKLTLEGRLTSGNEFDSSYPIYALLVYDPKPQTLTQGQLAKTYCYSYGEVITIIIPPSHTLGDGLNYTDTVEQPQCVDPYRIRADADKPESREEDVRLWEEAKRKSERSHETEISIPVSKAEKMATADGRFSLGVDVSKPLEEHGPGVYTVVLIAVLEDDQDRDETTISEYSIFHRTLRPSAYAPKRWVDREARED